MQKSGGEIDAEFLQSVGIPVNRLISHSSEIEIIREIGILKIFSSYCIQYKFLMRIIKSFFILYISVMLLDLLLFVGGYKNSSIFSKLFNINIIIFILCGVIILTECIDMIINKKWKRIRILFLLFIIIAIGYGITIEFLEKKAIEKAYENINKIFISNKSDSDIQCDKNVGESYYKFKENYDRSLIRLTEYSTLGSSYNFLVQPGNTQPFIIIMTRTDKGLKYWITKRPIDAVKEKIREYKEKK